MRRNSYWPVYPAQASSEPAAGGSPLGDAQRLCCLLAPGRLADVVFPCGHAFSDAALAPFGDEECVLCGARCDPFVQVGSLR